MAKTFKNLLQKHKSQNLETWHVSLGKMVYEDDINDDPGLTFTFFRLACASCVNTILLTSIKYMVEIT